MKKITRDDIKMYVGFIIFILVLGLVGYIERL
jgi:hypothetical protein